MRMGIFAGAASGSGNVDDQVAAGVERYRAAGLTDFLAVEYAAEPEVRDRTRQFLRGLL